MDENLPALVGSEHVTLLKLAREIAMDIRPIEEILKIHEVSDEDWGRIQNNANFQTLLRTEVEAWNAATNAAERVRLKSLYFVEESLPEFFARAHDRREPLNSKVEVLKTVAKLGGVGGTAETGVQGEKLMVTINLGSDQTLKIEKDVTSKVIDHED